METREIEILYWKVRLYHFPTLPDRSNGMMECGNRGDREMISRYSITGHRERESMGKGESPGERESERDHWSLRVTDGLGMGNGMSERSENGRQIVLKKLCS